MRYLKKQLIISFSSFWASHEGASFGYLTIELCLTEIKSWIFFLKSLEHKLLLELFLFKYIHIFMTLEDTTPSHSLLRLLQLYHNLLQSLALFILNIPN
jgi:hypothetical protein